MRKDIERWFDHRRASACGEKQRFEDEPEAEQAAYRVRLETGERLDVYRCLFCHGYHLGHSSRP
ncbi:MAG: hypothetical protein ACYDA6_03025 [Solirubrobacteraceae bacterium]